MHEGGFKKMQMKQPAKMTNSYGCKNEYDTLKRVIVCPPTYMKIEEIINETQKHYADENIDESLASKQHRQFVECLQKEGVEVIGLSAQEPFPDKYLRGILAIRSEIPLLSRKWAAKFEVEKNKC